MKVITKITYNWHMAGDAEDGIGEDYHIAEVGKTDTYEKKEVKGIQEYWKDNSSSVSYIIRFVDGSDMIIYNPNTVVRKEVKE